MRDLADLMDPALHLPIDGHDYAIGCTAHQGLHLVQMFADGIHLDDDAEVAEIRRMLGDTYQQMIDDGIGWPMIAAAGRTAMFHFGLSPEAGERMWAAGGVLGNSLPPKPKHLRWWRRRGSAAATANAAVN